MARRSGPQTEQERHKGAFEHYVAQGPGRSHQRTAADLGVSLAAVKAWSRAFGWKERLAKREAETTRKLADQARATGVVEKDRNLKIVHLGLLTLAKGIREGRIKGQMSDVDRLIRLEEYLTGADKPQGDADEIRVRLPPDWGPEDYRNFMIEDTIKTYCGCLPAEQKRIREAMDKHDAKLTSGGKSPVARGSPDQEPPSVEGQFPGGEGAERDSPEPGPPNSAETAGAFDLTG